MFDFQELDRRSRKDANFSALVNFMRSLMIQEGWTPLELRQAVFYACVKHEVEDVKSLVIHSNGTLEYKDSIPENKKIPLDQSKPLPPR